MKKIIFCILLLTATSAAFSQSEKNYILEVNGDTIHVSLGKTEMLKTRSGQLIPVKLTKKDQLVFRNEYLSFSYPSEFTVSTSKLDDGIVQILLMSATGNGVMIQCYDELNPTDLVDYMMNTITEDDIAAGYKAVKSTATHTLNSGMVLNGKKSVLTLNKDKEEFTVFSYGVRKTGFIIVELHNDFDNHDSEKVFPVFWNSLQVFLK